MKNTQHTPTPWAVDVQNSGTTGTHVIIDNNGKVIATITPLTDEEEEAANARLIAKAVNSHESLLAALKYLFEQSLKRDDAPDNEMDIAWAEATMAIKAAEEE